MFLNRLDIVEKRAFLDLAVRAAEANGLFDKEEYQMVEDYCKEMGIAFFDSRNIKEFKEIIEVFKNADEQNKKIAVLEIIGLMYADSEYDNKESQFVNSFAEGIGVSNEAVEKIKGLLKKYIDISGELVQCIE